MVDATRAKPLGDLVAGYRVEDIVGEGAMGTVYGATDPDGQPCAIKFLRKEMSDPERVRRFLRETKLAARLVDRHLVPVRDAGVHEGLPFLVMPLLAGFDLGRLLQQVGLLPPAPAVRIAIQACEGLCALHDDGIVHRDVKPTNLLLALEGADEVVVKICDFGIAKALTAEEHTQLTQTGAGLGSPYYTSPEQARDSKHVDERSDLFSLALTLYQMLCGTLPYPSDEGVGQYLVALTFTEPPSIQQRAPWIDPGLALALHRGLQRDMAHRWQTARQFAEALRPYAGGEARLMRTMLRTITARERAVVTQQVEIPVAPAPSSLAPPPPAEVAPVAGSERLVGVRLGDKYRVVRAIGSGGAGTIVEVETPTGRRAAAKIIAGGAGDAEMLARIVEQAKAAAAIRSPHVVRTLDAGRDPVLGAAFVVMELLDGADLAAIFDNDAPLEAMPLVRAIIQAGRGIAAAHKQGIVHGAVKPSNLFAHYEPATEQLVVKVCDFGIGSAEASAPVDHAADVRALCASLYEGLSGSAARGGAQIRRLAEVSPWIDADLALVVERGLAGAAEGGFRSAEEMIAALEPFAGTTFALRPGSLRGVPREQRR